MVIGKIWNVPDHVCEGPPECPQLYGGVCRAYLVPHTSEERMKRLVLLPNGSMQACFFRPPMKGEKYIEYGTTEIKVKTGSEYEKQIEETISEWKREGVYEDRLEYDEEDLQRALPHWSKEKIKALYRKMHGGFHVRYIDLTTGRQVKKDITEREQFDLIKAQREGKVSIIEMHRIPGP